MAIPHEKLCAGDVEIPQNMRKHIRPHGVSGVRVNAKRDAIAIAPSDLRRSNADTFLCKILNQTA